MKLYKKFHDKEKTMKDVIILGTLSLVLPYLFILIMGSICTTYPMLYHYTVIIGVVALGILLCFLVQSYQTFKNIKKNKDIN